MARVFVVKCSKCGEVDRRKVTVLDQWMDKYCYKVVKFRCACGSVQTSNEWRK